MKVVMKQITAKTILQVIANKFMDREFPTDTELSLGKEVSLMMADRATDDTLIHMSLSLDQLEAVRNLLTIDDFPIYI